MAHHSFEYYIDRYLQGNITPEEVAVLRTLLKDGNHEADLSRMLENSWEQWGSHDLRFPDVMERLEQAVKASRSKDSRPASPPPVHRVHFLHRLRQASGDRRRREFFKYAAAILILFGIGAYLYYSNEEPKTDLVKNDRSLPADISPGGNKAVLTLSDGSTIALDSAANGVLALQGNASVVKLSNGNIVYRLKGMAEETVAMNTLTTPNGGQYQITLPDGTTVWLNAASSITYPAAFVANERKVKVTGEVYFEVANNKAKPFIVDVDGQSSVEVLGTSFNVNSYADEGNIKTTLIDGSVRVMSSLPGENTSPSSPTGSSVVVPSDQQPAAKGIILKPGQQAVIAQSSSKDIQIQHANIAQVLAWKNGIFDFTNTDLQSLMKQIERWYDVDVKYEGPVPAIDFEGKVDRGVKLSGIIRFLSAYGINIRQDGKTLIVRRN